MVPEEGARVRIFNTETAMTDYITDVNYGRIVDDIDMPYLVMGAFTPHLMACK